MRAFKDAYRVLSNKCLGRSLDFVDIFGAFIKEALTSVVDFITNYHCTGSFLHEITVFRIRDVSKIPYTERTLSKLPYHRPKIVKY